MIIGCVAGVAVIAIVVAVFLTMPGANPATSAETFLPTAYSLYGKPDSIGEIQTYGYELDEHRYTVDTGDERWTYEIDDYGNVTHVTAENEDDEVVLTIDYTLERNAEGLATRADETRSDGSTGTTTTTYDNGRVREKHANLVGADGTVIYDTVTTYDASGFCTSVQSVDPTTGKTTTATYSYQGGTTAMPETLTVEDRLFRFEYDESGNLVSVYETDPNDGMEWLAMELRYESSEDVPIAIRANAALKPAF